MECRRQPVKGEPCGSKRVQMESALEELELTIDSDTIPDEVMTSLIEHLNSARVLDVPV